MNNLTQRQIILTVLIAYSAISLVLALSLITGTDTSPISIGGTFIAALVFAILSVAYWRGFTWAPHVTVAITAVMTGFIADFTGPSIPISTLIVPIIALVLTNRSWVIGSAVVLIGILMTRIWQETGGLGAYGNPREFIVYIMAIIGLILSRVMVDMALRVAQEHARQAAAARDRAEAHAAELATQARDLAYQNEEQRRLLELVSTLETPAVAVAQGVLLAPIIGALDSRRAQDLMRRLLNTVSEQRIRHVLIDISGVSVVDTDVARALIQMIQALGLLGCQVTLTGIAASVATSITQLGINLEGIQIARSPQDVLTKLI